MSHFTCGRCDHFFSANDAIETPTTRLFEGIHDRPATREHVIVLLCPSCLSNRLEPSAPCSKCHKAPALEVDDYCNDCLMIELDHPGERTAVAAERDSDSLRDTLVDIATGDGHVR